MASLDAVSIGILLGALLVLAGIMSSLIAMRFGAPLLGREHLRVDEFKLGVAIRVGRDFPGLAVGLEAIPQVVQQQGDRRVADLMTLPP